MHAHTVPQCCPTSDGAGAAILCSERFVYKYGLQNTAVEIVGMAMATDKKSSFGDNMMDTVGYDMTKRATQQVEEQSGVSVQDVQVVELHDCFSANELITYEALGLCKEGEAGAFIDRGDNTYGGKFVINPSGGLISKGHPLGATGLAQCAEMCWQLRGLAEKRQVDNVKYALQHNLGLGGAAVVTMYTRAKLRSGGNTVRSTSTSRAESLGQAPVAVAAPIPAPAAAEEKVSSSSPGGFAAEAVFAEMGAQLQAAPKELISKINCTYRFDLKSGQSKKSWIVDCKSFPASVVEGSKKCDCMIAISDKDFVLLMAGKLNPMQAYMKGKLKITGNMMLAQKLDLLKQAKPAL
jgi:sterol carrier protein 2